MKMRLTGFAFCTMLAAGQAAALSCLPPDPVRLYTEARDSAETFAIVVGRLRPAKPIAVPEVPRGGTSQKGLAATTRVRMTGLVLGETGLTHAFDREIDVTVSCLSVWCGEPVTGRDILAALKVTEDVPELFVGPCGGRALVTDETGLDRLLACHRNGLCQGTVQGPGR